MQSRSSRWRRWLAALSLAVPAAAFAQGAAPSPQTPQRGGTLVAIVQPEPVIITSALNTAQPTGQVSPNIFDGLVEFDLDGNPRPGLAEKWAFSPDGLSLTLTLRRGVKWHDGKPFSSADVKWTAENVWKTLNPRTRVVFERLVEVATPDANTAILRFEKPSLAVLSTLSSYGAQVLPKHLYENTDVLNNPYNNKPVGTGPFVFKEWKKGEYITLERNPDYWDKPKPYVDRLVFRVISDAGLRAAALEKGEVHYAAFSPVPLRDAKRLGALPTLTLDQRGYDAIAPVLLMDYNIENPSLKDVRVRRAIAHAINRQGLVNVVWYGFGKPATSLVASSNKTFFEPSLDPLAYDTKKAEALLDEAGFKRGADGVRFRISHDFPAYGEDYQRTAEYIANQLKRVGIEVTVRAPDTPVFTKRVFGEGAFDTNSRWTAGNADPQLGVFRNYWSGWIGKNVPWTNGSRYNSREADALIEDIQTNPDAAKRIAQIKAFQQLVQKDLPLLPLIELSFVTLHASTLRDVTTGNDQAYSSLKNAWFGKGPDPQKTARK